MDFNDDINMLKDFHKYLGKIIDEKNDIKTINLLKDTITKFNILKQNINSEEEEEEEEEEEDNDAFWEYTTNQNNDDIYEVSTCEGSDNECEELYYCDVCNSTEVVTDENDYFGSCAGICNNASLCEEHANWDSNKNVYFCDNCFVNKEAYYDKIDLVSLEEDSSSVSSADESEDPPVDYFELFKQNLNKKKEKEAAKNQEKIEAIKSFINEDILTDSIILYCNNNKFNNRLNKYLNSIELY